MKCQSSCVVVQVSQLIPKVPGNTKEILGLVLENPRISKEVLGTFGKGMLQCNNKYTMNSSQIYLKLFFPFLLCLKEFFSHIKQKIQEILVGGPNIIVRISAMVELLVEYLNCAS